MSKVFAPTVLLILVVATSASGGDNERPLKVFVLAGTSNMLGAPAKIDNLPDDLRQPLKDVLVIRRGSGRPWRPARTWSATRPRSAVP